MAPDQALPAGASRLPAIDPRLLTGFALPLLQQVVARGAPGGARLPLLALNGPVGAGKTSLGRVLESLAPALGLRLVVASIDDLYLPSPLRQQRLVGNPFGVSRVPPGSHDLELLLEALAHWRQSGVLRLPRFDKTLAQGEGDRLGWRQGPCDALVLEGWLMGCRALGPEALARALEVVDLEQPGPGGAPALTPCELGWLGVWDRQLEAYGPLWDACDGLWLLRPLSWQLPRRWRFQAEAHQRRKGGGWLQPTVLDRMVRSSLCSLPPSLYQDPLVMDPLLILESEQGTELTIGDEVLPASLMEPLDWMGQTTVGLATDTWRPALSGGYSQDARSSATVDLPASGGAVAKASPTSGQQQHDRLGQDRSATACKSAAATGSEETLDDPLEILDSGSVSAGGLMPEGHAVQRLEVQGLAVLDGRRRCRALWRLQSGTQASPSVSSSLMG